MPLFSCLFFFIITKWCNSATEIIRSHVQAQSSLQGAWKKWHRLVIQCCKTCTTARAISVGKKKLRSSNCFQSLELFFRFSFFIQGPPDSYRLNHITKAVLETRLSAAKGRPLVILTVSHSAGRTQLRDAESSKNSKISPSEDFFPKICPRVLSKPTLSQITITQKNSVP